MQDIHNTTTTNKSSLATAAHDPNCPCQQRARNRRRILIGVGIVAGLATIAVAVWFFKKRKAVVV
jgi:hypothetical protein